MSRPIITVENLSKRYLLGHQSRRERYTALRDVLSRHARNAVRKTRDMLTGRQIVQGDEVEEFWALRDVSFEIQPGEVIGIIGRNGAGKSTLLKVLSRITEPTEGRVRLRGRVASLLEVGTGFHPELTGRENIYLNGAILGMPRAEIARKFDEIVGFAEVEKFLDTPVKRYSSGMYVRLAFGVAAHLQPDILVVDEVLAVGDAAFQKKCLGKMHDAAHSGRTVLFVSHNLAAIRKLCCSALLLRNGQLQCHSDVDDAVQAYVSGAPSLTWRATEHEKITSSDGKISIVDVSIRSTVGLGIETGAPVSITLVVDFGEPIRNPGFVISLGTGDDMEIARFATTPISGVETGNCFGRVFAELNFARLPLTGGRYALRAGISRPNVGFLVPITRLLDFEVLPTDYYNSGCEMTHERGFLVIDHFWNIAPAKTFRNLECTAKVPGDSPRAPVKPEADALREPPA